MILMILLITLTSATCEKSCRSMAKTEDVCLFIILSRFLFWRRDLKEDEGISPLTEIQTSSKRNYCSSTKSRRSDRRRGGRQRHEDGGMRMICIFSHLVSWSVWAAAQHSLTTWEASASRMLGIFSLRKNELQTMSTSKCDACGFWQLSEYSQVEVQFQLQRVEGKFERSEAFVTLCSATEVLKRKNNDDWLNSLS